MRPFDDFIPAYMRSIFLGGDLSEHLERVAAAEQFAPDASFERTQNAILAHITMWKNAPISERQRMRSDWAGRVAA